MVHGSPWAYSGVCLRKRRINDEFEKKTPADIAVEGTERRYNIIKCTHRNFLDVFGAITFLPISLSLSVSLYLSQPLFRFLLLTV